MSHHETLWAACRKLPGDYKPYGDSERDIDCSAGCKFFYVLAHRDGEHLGYDWGICANPRSHRCGLLTFEHQGCGEFESPDRAS